MKFILARAFYRFAICLPYRALCPAKHHFLFIGSLKPDSCSTCRKNTDGLISSELQISKMLRREGFVLHNSTRLTNARSYPDLAPRALGSSSTAIDDSEQLSERYGGSRFGLFFAEDATPQSANILRAAYSSLSPVSSNPMFRQ